MSDPSSVETLIAQWRTQLEQMCKNWRAIANDAKPSPDDDRDLEVMARDRQYAETLNLCANELETALRACADELAAHLQAQKAESSAPPAQAPTDDEEAIQKTENHADHESFGNAQVVSNCKESRHASTGEGNRRQSSDLEPHRARRRDGSADVSPPPSVDAQAALRRFLPSVPQGTDWQAHRYNTDTSMKLVLWRGDGDKAETLEYECGFPHSSLPATDAAERTPPVADSACYPASSAPQAVGHATDRTSSVASLGRGLDPEGETGKRASVDGLREMVDLLLQQRGKPILAFVRERDRDAAYQVGLMLDELARALDINSPSLPHVPIKPWFPEGDPEGERRPPQQGEKQCR